MQEVLHPRLDERRQTVRPIGGERTQRKGAGSMVGPGSDFGESLWGYQSGKLLPSLQFSFLLRSVEDVTIAYSLAEMAYPACFQRK